MKKKCITELHLKKTNRKSFKIFILSKFLPIFFCSFYYCYFLFSSLFETSKDHTIICCRVRSFCLLKNILWQKQKIIGRLSDVIRRITTRYLTSTVFLKPWLCYFFWSAQLSKKFCFIKKPVREYNSTRKNCLVWRLRFIFIDKI